MKKLLSLILAVLTVASLAICTSAGNIISSSDFDDKPSYSTSGSNPVRLGDLFGFYKDFFNPGSSYPKDWNWIKKGDYYTTWYGTCPKCEGFAFYYVSDGTIKWICLESKCGKSGTFKPDIGKDDDKDTGVIICPKCKKSDKVIVLEKVYNTDKTAYGYRSFCSRCDYEFVGKYTSSTLPPYKYTEIPCAADGCTKKATLLIGENGAYDHEYKDGYVYAIYRCEDGHKTYVKTGTYCDDSCWDWNWSDYYKYTIRVITTRGGDYTIKGGNTAYYGDVKTIVFEPDYGYVLTDVLVNGESVTPDEELKITVKGNTVVRAYFERKATLRNYTVKASANGNGTVTATLNDKSVDASKITAKYTDKIVYYFKPASKNYYVSDVKVNGKSVGRVSYYTVSKLDADTKIEVTFTWKSPFADVKVTDKHAKAVEYATEVGILSGRKTGLKRTFNFSGTTAVSVRTFVCALAEMCDVNDKLTNNTDRVDWAVNYGLIDEDEDISVTCSVQRACQLVDDYLELIEDKNDIEFDDFDRDDSAKENCISIGMITANTYKKNRDLNRYDLAEVLYLISNLEY